MPVLYKNHEPSFTGGPSPRLWDSCPTEILRENPGMGFCRQWTGADVLHNGSLLELAGWKSTIQGATSAVSVLAGHGGGMVVTTDDAADDDGLNAQLVGQGVDLQSIARGWMEMRIKVDAVTQYLLGFGLATTDTTVVDSAVLACTEFSGFLGLVGASNSVLGLVNQTGGSGAETTTLTDSTTALLTADTYVQLGLQWGQSPSVTAYLNGVKDVTYATATDYPTGVVVPTIFVGTNTTASRVFTIPWVKVAFEY